MTKSARVLTVALVALFAAATGATATPAAAATSTAVVVIDSPQGQRSAVIHFDGTISGIDALELAGGDPQLAGYSGVGGAVCTIDGYGNDQTKGANCLVGPNSQYWAYFRSHNGASSWSYSNAGGGGTTVSDGDVEGWRYGVGQSPRLSASFCSYVPPCPPPPTEPTAPTAAPPVVVAPPAEGIDLGNGAAAGTTTAPTTTTNGTAKAGDGSASAGQDDATENESNAGKVTDATTPNRRAVSTDRSEGGDTEVALGSSGPGDGGSGSPVGVMIVAGILVLVAAVVVAQRRRTRSAPDL